ncbi:MAG: type III secretion system chaperone [Pseudomonadota bacterium]
MMSAFAPELERQVEQTLTRVGRELNITLRFDAEGACYFQHREGWNIAVIRSGTDQLVITVSVVTQEFPTAETISALLSQFGWLGFGTGGAALSYNPESGSFVLWRSIDAATADANQVNRELLRVIGYAAKLRRPLQAALVEAAADQSTADTDNDAVPAHLLG